MRFKYIASDNSTSDASAFNSTGQDCFIKKIFFGAPADGDLTNLYNKSVATGHTSGMGSVSTANLAWHHTQATHAEGTDWERVVEFAGEFNPGLQLDGGSIHTNASSVTVIWDDK